MMQRCRRLMGVSLLCVLGCTSAGTTTSSTDTTSTDDTSTDATDVFADAQWRLATPYNVKAGLVFSADAGTLTLVNSSGEALGTPSLFIYDAEGTKSAVTMSDADAVADGATGTGTLTYPGSAAPGTDAYFGLAIDAVTVGKFVSATAFDALPLSTQNGPSSETSTSSLSAASNKSGDPPVPTTGLWSFSMTASSANLSCAASIGSLSSAGSGTLSVSCDGFTANLDIDSAHLTYDQFSGGLFKTPDYSFITRDEDDNPVVGDLHYDFTASSTEALSGTLYWDNNLNCTGEYPYTMGLQTATTATVNDLCEGVWTLSYDSAITCGLTPITLGGNGFEPGLVGTLSTTDLPSGVPLSLMYNGGVGNIFMIRTGCTNVYGNAFAPSVFGFMTDISGMPMNVNMGFQGVALSNTQITGVGYFNGIGPSTTCVNVPFFFTLSTTTSC